MEGCRVRRHRIHYRRPIDRDFDGEPVRRHTPKNRRKIARKKVKNGCTNKKRFLELQDAVDAAAILLRSAELPATGVYQCRRGNHYHVTSDTTWGPLVVLLEDKDRIDDE